MRFLLRLRIAFVASVAGVVLTACTVGPDFRRPEVAVSQNWMDAGDNRVKSEAADYRNWWRTFHDPVLDRLIDKAYEDNLTLRIAGVRVLEARALLGIAIGELYPQTQQASGSLQYNRISEHGVLAVSAQKFQYWQSEVGVNASWEIDFWGKFRRAIESADAGWLATVADYDNALVSLTADVANSYITVRTLEKRIEIARQNAETQNENLKIAEARFKYGAATELDVEQARTVLNNTLAAIPSLEAQLRQTKHALSVLLGLAPGDLLDYLESASGIPAAPSEIVVGIPAELLRRRPDIRSAEYQAAAQSAQIGVAKADLYPSLSLTGSFGFLSTNTGTSHLSDLFKWPSRSIVAGPTFQWNLFNYGQITNNVRVQDARLQELLITYQNTVLSAQKDVEDNLVGFLRAQERADYLAKSARAAKSALDIAVKQYREGVKDFTAVLLAQQSLLNEQDNLAATLGNTSASLVGVYRALGGGWEIREGKELVPERMKEDMEKRTNWGNLLAPASYNPPAGKSPESSIRPPDW